MYSIFYFNNSWFRTYNSKYSIDRKILLNLLCLEDKMFKNKKYSIFNAIIFIIFYFVMGFFVEKFSIYTWMLMAVMLEIFLQILDRLYEKWKNKK